MCTERLAREVDVPIEWVVGFKKLECAVVAGLEIEFWALVKFFQPLRYLKTLCTSDDSGG